MTADSEKSPIAFESTRSDGFAKASQNSSAFANKKGSEKTNQSILKRGNSQSFQKKSSLRHGSQSQCVHKKVSMRNPPPTGSGNFNRPHLKKGSTRMSFAESVHLGKLEHQARKSHGSDKFDHKDSQASHWQKRVTSVLSSSDLDEEDGDHTLSLIEEVEGTGKSFLQAFVNHSVFQGLTMVFLVVALFMPDLCIVIGVPMNLPLDIMLTGVLVIFSIEFICLSLTDREYKFSFFFYMDLIGSISIIFDIPYMLGPNAEKVEVDSGGGSDTNMVAFRAARAAKVGARAGRLAKLLKVLRYVPGIRTVGNEKSDRGRTPNAKMITGKLTNVLSSRVACLAVIMSLAIPLLTEVWNYPVDDYAPRAWVGSLLITKKEGVGGLTYEDELKIFGEAFNKYAYGPFQVCTGTYKGEDNSFLCQGTPDTLENSKFKGHERASFQLVLYDEDFAAFYDMTIPKQVEAWANMAVITFMVIIMVFYGLLLSNNVTILVVRPVEKLLAQIKATTALIWGSVQCLDVTEDDLQDEAFQNTSETELLEIVLERVTNILLVSNNVPTGNREALTSEEQGVVDLMANTMALTRSRPEPEEKDEDESKENTEDKEVRGERGSVLELKELRLAAQAGSADSAFSAYLNASGSAKEKLGKWDLNPLELESAQATAIGCCIVAQSGQVFNSQSGKLDDLEKFAGLLCNGYMANPFHNWFHAIDVGHTVFSMAQRINDDGWMPPLELEAIFIAAIAHDIGHLGVNNGFLIEIGDELALRYNDHSPLEHMHCATLFEIVKAENVFGVLKKGDFQLMRKVIIDCILHTDMVLHFEMVKELTLLYEVNSSIFRAGSVRKADFFDDPKKRVVINNMLVHAADISNPSKPFHACRMWAERALEEFFAQGDEERKRGIPVQMLNDRENVNKPLSQVSFIEFICAPFVATQAKLFPALQELSEQLAQNMSAWENIWEDLSKPSNEERDKVLARVQKVSDMLVQESTKSQGLPKFKGVKPAGAAPAAPAMKKGATSEFGPNDSKAKS